jgi:ribulose-5-phosphate 4-epimerase/fuculose-1-phosphate aldolase
VHDIGDKHLMILRNHGTLTLGTSCADTFMRMFYLERSCSMQVRALAGGVAINKTNQGVADKAAKQGEAGFAMGMGNLAWPALLRKLDRIDPSYRN